MPTADAKVENKWHPIKIMYNWPSNVHEQILSQVAQEYDVVKNIMQTLNMFKV